MKKILEFLFLSVVVAISSSCNVDEEITVALPPKIILDSETGVYTTKQGREIVIAPSYESAEGAYYRWTMEGRLLGTGASLSFMREECGEYYVTLTITTDGGSDSEEIRVDVVALERPMVSISGNKRQTIAIGTEVVLHAMVRDSSLQTTLVWTINGEQVCEEPEYTFKAEAAGSYAITARATNEDGTHSDTIEIEVVRAEDMPLVWEFDRVAYHTATGRKLQIKPSSVSDSKDIVYTWQIGDETAQRGEASFVFTADTAGQYTITATATTEESGTQISLTHKFVVTVYEAGAFYRAASSMSNATWNRVLEYTPAPGQFINELKTGGFDGSQTTMESAIAYAEKRLRAKNWVSLGGFGGYIVVGFDHSIDNSGDYDLGVIGNAFDGSSEPGIVWVMQDENGNGLPDDTWYELQGSETGKAETIQNYAVTYYRPTGTQMPVWWSDNLGNSGSIDYLAQFHTQDYYYPLWIEEDSYTLTGTLLEARNYDKSGDGSYWVQPHYDWGYADNFSPTDFSSSDKANLFKISNAIDCECEPIHLDYIDFVKVQVGVNAKSGWLGELSTEVCGFYDFNLIK